MKRSQSSRVATTTSAPNVKITRVECSTRLSLALIIGAYHWQNVRSRCDPILQSSIRKIYSRFNFILFSLLFNKSTAIVRSSMKANSG